MALSREGKILVAVCAVALSALVMDRLQLTPGGIDPDAAASGIADEYAVEPRLDRGTDQVVGAPTRSESVLVDRLSRFAQTNALAAVVERDPFRPSQAWLEGADLTRQVWTTYVRPHYLSRPSGSVGVRAPSVSYTPKVAENGSYYGQTSTVTGRPKTVYVRGYYRKDGTYVRPHYRSRPGGSVGARAPPVSYTPKVAENGSYYGQTSTVTGRPKTIRVRGYYRRDGTYVRSHYRSRPRR